MENKGGAERSGRSRDGNTVATVVVSLAILAVAGLLVFWNPSSGGPAGTSKADDADAPSASPASPRPEGARSAIAAREMDEPTPPTQPKGRVNPLLVQPNFEMSPAPPPRRDPPTFETAADEIAWVEDELTRARKMLEARATFLERHERRRERAVGADEDAKATAEQRGAIVRENFEHAQAKVAELEARLVELNAGAPPRRAGEAP